ncbi:uncharacterized protein LOC128264622 [Drosophila gunungcola]|uniref:Uncharacterized protein n=1 Tax=Drosophila gunungcola TaxID=103775 RepID=A0A9P9YC63_9MUSC|nr:uncharacterized protein LOC128264622 [Drosophila gunungcola]KAI8034314.1 hypothetical protein M5D96_012867 [Drosophila gunungcola]
MPSSRFDNQLQIHLLLCALLLAAGQRIPVRVPQQDLQVPNFGGESFERFASGSGSGSGSSSSGSSESQETSDEMREQLKQLLGNQLSKAFVPLATTPFTRRQPAIVAPTSSGTAARTQFNADQDQDQDTNEEESPEEEEGGEGNEEEEEEQVTQQPQPMPPPLPQPAGPEEELIGGQEEVLEDYNPWRDNFYDLNEDGSYIFGYSIPHGVRRWEKGFFSEEQHGKVVEGFYVQPRQISQGLGYELRCYRSDANGYQPMPVEFLRTPPVVRRDVVPQVNCFRNSDDRRL